MDTKLLNALNNIGDALDALVEALNDKASAKSEAGAALQTGDFGKQLESISKDIKSIKADTQEILKQQKTILSQAKSKEADSKLGIMDSLGGDDSMMKNITKGIGVIMLLAVAVLAIGMAFKLVGGVDILSVIGLAISITIISIAFEKVANLKIGLKEAAITSAIMVVMSFGLMLSSKILNMITPVSPVKMLTAIVISAGFSLLGPHIGKFINSFKDIGFLSLIKAVIFLPSILAAISFGIALSSEYLQGVKPIGLIQAVSSILIAGVFAVISFGIGNLVRAFKGIDTKTALIASGTIPILMIAMSAAIWGASELLGKVQPITFGQFFTSLFISVVFIALSFSASRILSSLKGVDPKTAAIASASIPILMIAMSAAIWGASELLSNVVPISTGQFFTSLFISIVFIGLSFSASLIIKQMKGIDPATLATAVIGIPLLMIAMSTSIWASSHILDKMIIVSEDKLINAGLIGAGLALLSIAMAPTIKILSKIGIVDIIKGALIIPIIATTVMISSHILALGNYEDGSYPSLSWTLGVAAAMLPFGLGMFALGTIASGPGALVLLAGSVAVLGVATTIALTSHILKEGDYSIYPGLDWSLGVSLSLGAFALGMTTLGAIIFATFGIGGAMLAAGGIAVLSVAKTIVAASDILANGYIDDDGKLMKPNYTGGPTEEWAKGISLALGAFSPVYGMLMKNKILSFLGGGVGPDDFVKAIKTVSRGIVSAGEFFSSKENQGVWKPGPTKEWAEGIGLAIGAFAPVYEILLANSGFLKSDISPEKFAGTFKDGKLVKDGAIQIISRGIVSAAQFFAENTSPFEEGKYPSENWGKGVGAALGAFAPVFNMMMEKSGFWKKGSSVVNDMIYGIKGISSAIVSVATLFSQSVGDDIFKVYPEKDWANNVGDNVMLFSDIAKYINENKIKYRSVQDVVNRIVGVARTIYKNSDLFSMNIDPNYIKNISQNILDFSELSKKLVESESDDRSLLSRLGDSLTGNDPIVMIAKRMTTLAEGYDKLANSLIKLGTAMRVLNISDVSKLGGLTRTIISPSESGSIKKSLTGETPSIKSGDTSLFENFFGKKDEDKDNIGMEDPVTSRLDQVIDLLTSINNNTVNINEFIELQSEGEIEVPTDVSA